MAECPIWKTGARIIREEADNTLVNSPRAEGLYWISGRARVVVENEAERVKALLTSLLMEKRQSGEKQPKIDTYTIEEARIRRPLSVHERADRVLEYIAEQSQYVGHWFPANRLHSEHLYPLLARSESALPASSAHYRQQREEIRFFTDYLVGNGWLSGGTEGHRFHITVEGYSHLRDMAYKVVPSTRAFVAMWFDASMSSAYSDGIMPAVESCGYDPIRVDQIEHAGKIDDRIIAELRASRFVVADFTQGGTGARGGVYYEAGFAQALGIPVIFTCRKDCIQDLHFDTRQFNHIDWKDPSDLRERLSVRIKAVVI